MKQLSYPILYFIEQTPPPLPPEVAANTEQDSLPLYNFKTNKTSLTVRSRACSTNNIYRSEKKKGQTHSHEIFAAHVHDEIRSYSTSLLSS